MRLEEPPDGDPAARQRAAQAAGFAVARHGPEAIEAALDRLAGLADRAGDGPNKAFGPLFQNLSQAYREEPAFAPFRKLLRDRILEVWPIAPGTELLGEVVAERRLHSVLTAAQEAGIGTALMEQLLIEAGAIAAGVLVPRAPRAFGRPGGCGTASIWWPRCRRARSASRQARRGGRACSGLAPAREILAAIRDGRLQVGQQARSDGWRSFRVRKAEIDRMARPRGAPTERGMIPAGAVAREVGLRDGGHFLAGGRPKPGAADDAPADRGGAPLHEPPGTSLRSTGAS